MTFDDLPEPARIKAERVAAAFDGCRRVGIAYSGGVDSAVLLAIAVRALGADNALGLLALSPSLARTERESAHATAAEIGATVVEFDTHEINDPNYQRNQVDRCFFCKNELFTVISDDIICKYHLNAVAYGENADDAKAPDRPGALAATKHKVLRPLADAGFTKADVRQLARDFGLGVADKPASPCLASRIPHNQPVTVEKLRQIEAGEEVVRRFFSDARVRHHGDIARIEVPLAEFDTWAAPGVREEVLAGLRKAGFKYATIDLAGLQSGAFTLQILSRKNG